jgi:hypothetical protein
LDPGAISFDHSGRPSFLPAELFNIYRAAAS